MQFRHKNIDMGVLGSPSLPPLQTQYSCGAFSQHKHYRSASINMYKTEQKSVYVYAANNPIKRKAIYKMHSTEFHSLIPPRTLAHRIHPQSSHNSRKEHKPPHDHIPVQPSTYCTPSVYACILHSATQRLLLFLVDVSACTYCTSTYTHTQTEHASVLFATWYSAGSVLSIRLGRQFLT